MSYFISPGFILPQSYRIPGIEKYLKYLRGGERPESRLGGAAFRCEVIHPNTECKVNLWLILIWALSHTFHSTIPLYTAADQSENRAPFMQEHRRHASDMTSNIPHTTLEHRVNVTAAFLRWQKKLQNNVIQCNTPKHITCRFHGITASFFFFSHQNWKALDSFGISHPAFHLRLSSANKST